MVVEDGTGIQLANSYASEDTLGNYADDRAITLSAGDGEAALIRATQYIDTYRFRFPGYRLKRRLQGLEWPRVGAYTSLSSDGREYAYPAMYHGEDPYQLYMGYSYIPSNEVPIEVINATCEAAIRELSVPGSMQPDLARGDRIKSLSAGSVGIVYMDGATPGTVTQIIDGILAGLLIPSVSWVGTSSRG